MSDDERDDVPWYGTPPPPAPPPPTQVPPWQASPPPAHLPPGSAPHYGASPYGPPPSPYGYVPPPKTNGKAIAALIFACASFASCPVIPAIVALVLAGTAEREIAASAGRESGAGLVTAARVLAIVNIVLFSLWFAIAMASSGSSTAPG